MDVKRVWKENNDNGNSQPFEYKKEYYHLEVTNQNKYLKKCI